MDCYICHQLLYADYINLQLAKVMCRLPLILLVHLPGCIHYDGQHEEQEINHNDVMAALLPHQNLHADGTSALIKSSEGV